MSVLVACAVVASVAVAGSGTGGGEKASSSGFGSPARTAAPPASASRADTRSQCFGAAARDPQRPQCAGTPLRFTVTPAPGGEALLQPSAPCKIIQKAAPEICQFGVTDKPTANFALMGDSHSVHWRAALAHVAATKGWRGLSFYRSGCPFTLAPIASGGCLQQARNVLEWFENHPEVSTVFVSANTGRGVRSAPGETPLETKTRGYMRAWQGLPRTVRRIYVIHDMPHVGRADCVKDAVANHRDAGARCAVPRAAALRLDPQAAAAEQSQTDRIQLIDLTSFVCDDETCFPVVGGALVIRDVGHMTRTFSTSLGPYLLQAVNRLLAAPPTPGR